MEKTINKSKSQVNKAESNKIASYSSLNSNSNLNANTHSNSNLKRDSQVSCFFMCRLKVFCRVLAVVRVWGSARKMGWRVRGRWILAKFTRIAKIALISIRNNHQLICQTVSTTHSKQIKVLSNTAKQTQITFNQRYQ